MGSVRRLATALFVLPLLIIAGLTATTMTSASASPGVFSAPAPTQMSYACALKSNGLLRYVTSTSKCLKAETPVTISPGPNYARHHQDDLAYLVSSLNSRPVPKNKAALTLPPSSSPDYFCAVAIIGTLTYTTDPKKCLPIIEFPVVVPVPHSPPVLANIETTALAYTGGSGLAAVTSTLTVSSADATTLAGATVSISAGLATAEDSLGRPSGGRRGSGYFGRDHVPMGCARFWAANGRDQPVAARVQVVRIPEVAGTQVTWTPAGPLPDRAAELNGTEIASRTESPPGNRGVLALEVPTTPWLVLTTARQVARPIPVDWFDTTKVTFARGVVVVDA